MMRNFLTWVCLVALLPVSNFAQEILPLSEVKPGMAGIARTVFRGDRPEEFPIEVVDIQRNFYPKRNLIIIRLKGEKAEHTGTAAGMSGSPIYVDGKIIGALSYSVGIFLREPLAGVTPIEEMLEIFNREETRDRELAVFSPSGQNQFLDMALSAVDPLWENFVPQELLQRRAALNGTFRPIDLPLNFGGMRPDLVQQAADLLRPAGFLAVSGGGTNQPQLDINVDAEQAALLQPGAAIGAVLVAGDANIEAIGTVSYRRGDQVLAFGHPFFDSGPVEIPFSLARILLTVPSDFSSYKLGFSSKILGTLRQDRTTGIYGVIGATPALVPMIVRYTDEAGNASQFEFRFTDERSINTIMPLVMRFVLVNALESARLATGENSLQLNGSIQLQSGEKIAFEDFYPGYASISGIGFLNGILQSTGEVAATLGAIMTNHFQPVKLAKVELNFNSVVGRRNATIEQVWIDRQTVEPGDTVTVLARLKAVYGPEKLFRQQLIVPKNAQGRFLTITVAGGDDLTQLERRAVPGRFAARSFNQLLSLLQERRRNDILYYQLRQPDLGLIIEGEQLNALPPSVYSVLQSQNLKGNASFVREQVLAELRQTISMPANLRTEEKQKTTAPGSPFAVSGLKTIRLRLR